MKTTATLLIALVAAVFVLPLEIMPAAAANRVSWVSGNGSDANDCATPATACQSLHIAIGATLSEGAVRCLTATTDINLRIARPMTIDCSGASAVIYGVTTPALTIDIDESTDPDAIVTLRGLAFDSLNPNNLGGIQFVGGGAALRIEECHIAGFNQQGLNFSPSTSVDLFIRDTIISGNSGAGIRIAPASAGVRASLNNVRLDGNGTGLIVAKASGAKAVATFENSQAEKNGIGLRAYGASTSILISASTIAHNATGLSVANGGTIVSFGNNGIADNTANGAPTSTITLK